MITEYFFRRLKASGNKGFDDKYYKDLIVEYLRQYKKAKKKDIRELLWDKLSDALSEA